VTGGTTLYAMTGPDMETFPGKWLVTSEKTRNEVELQRIAYQKERREQTYGSGSVRSYSGGNARYSGRVK